MSQANTLMLSSNQRGLPVSRRERDINRLDSWEEIVDSSSLAFQGVQLQFAPGTRTYLDSDQVLLCVRETVPNGSASVIRQAAKWRARSIGAGVREERPYSDQHSEGPVPASVVLQGGVQ